MSERKKLHVLPTGKTRVSYSECVTWLRCPFMHKLAYIDGIREPPNEHLAFGSAMHAAVEEWLGRRCDDASAAPDVNTLERELKKRWEEYLLESDVNEWLAQGRDTLVELPAWMDATFPEWRPVAVELKFNEPVSFVDDKLVNVTVMGFIDAIIEHTRVVRGKPKRVVRVIDWKTTSWGWKVEKMRDPLVTLQLALYKRVVAHTTGTDPRDIKASFVLLTRTGKPGARVKHVEVSVGPKSLKRVDDMIRMVVSGIASGITLKNRASCSSCSYAGTQHCPGSHSHAYTKRNIT